ncbi:STAS domain-containing protein [Pilimelia terevasa]|uniref:STAS domain-containing protein n=1 Tax=Pilimelia terevasa TaxID=53372 RepID=UPI00166855E4|nr:STAS domain-containing protein [Pilimelia terevasa]
MIRLNEAALVWADGRLCGTRSQRLDAALQSLLDEGASPLVVDLARVSALDVDAVEALAEAAEDAGHIDLALDLCLPGDRRAVVRDSAELRHAIFQVYPCVV